MTNDITPTCWLAEGNAGELYLGVTLSAWLRLGHEPAGNFADDAFALIHGHVEPPNVRERVAGHDMLWKSWDRRNGTALIAKWTAGKGVQVLTDDLVNSHSPRGALANAYLAGD